ncbi:MAG: rhomboid family intramembrane serine protease [Polyangiaceae bacterium]|nr:rhomboid family intramembrane serine protease [Polyangiaceae bacterium]
MRELKICADAQEAEALCDYLETLSIESTTRKGKEGYSVWVRNDGDLPQAQKSLGTFEPNRENEYAKKAKKKRQERRTARQPVATPAFNLRGRAATTSFTPVVMIVMAAAIICFLLNGFGDRFPPELSITPPVNARALSLQIDWSQPWRLITPIFIHSGFLHIAFNLYWLYLLGGPIESRSGTLRFVLMVVIIAGFSNLAQFLMSGPLFGGLSGVVYGLFGYRWMYSRYCPQANLTLNKDTTTWMLAWLLISATGLVGNVANSAHSFGLISGILLGVPAFIDYTRKYSWKRSFTPGSWEDLNIQGRARFQRLYLEPYMPLWFIALSLLVAYFGR